MLRLSKKIDYGLMALLHLARYEDTPSWSAREIAERYAIPPELLAKVLQKMAHHGLVSSHQGTRGGYRLGKPASEITAAQVIEAIDGPVSLTQCFTSEGTCLQFDTCSVKSPLQSLNERVGALFARLTLAQLLEQESEELNASPEEQPALLPVLR